MFLYRSLTVGLLGACCFMLTRRPAVIPVQLELPTPASIAVAQQAPLQVIDVAANAAPDQVAQLVKLAPGERIAMVDDLEVDNPVTAVLDVMMSAARKEPGWRNFVDLTVRGGADERRILLLMH